MEVRSVADDDYGGQIRDLCGQGTPIGGGGGGGKREKKKGGRRWVGKQRGKKKVRKKNRNSI